MGPQLPKPRNLEKTQAPETDQELSKIEAVEEKNLTNPELTPAASTTQSVTSASAQASQIAVAADNTLSDSMTPANDQTNPAVAGDDDVIEKEWVDRAKEVVNKTREDPRQQKNEVNLLQADYLEKRYNKKIKLNEPNNK